MKRFYLLVLVVVLGLNAGAQTAAFKRSGTNLPFATTISDNHVFNIDRGGGAAPANVTWQSLQAEISKRVVTNFTARTFNAVTYGADASGATDSSAAFNALTAAVGYTPNQPGLVFFPSGTFQTTNALTIFGVVPGDTNLYGVGGYVDVKGAGYSRINYSGNSNALEITTAQTFAKVSDLEIVGTNIARSGLGKSVGILLHGPSGGSTVEDVSVQRFWVGLWLHNITGGYSRNAYLASNFVGAATSYKPDGVQLHGRFERNVYGVWIGMTNANQVAWKTNEPFSLWSAAGQPKVSGVAGFNTVGVLVSSGPAVIEDMYFEGNGTSVQIGCNTGNAFEATYGAAVGISGVLPVLIKNFDANAANDVRVYQKTDLRSMNCQWFRSSSSIRLMNASGDSSTIDSDTPVTVINSSSVSFAVDNNWRYVNGALVPRSGMSYTNLLNVPSSTSTTWDDQMDDSIVYGREDFFGGTYGTADGTIGQYGWHMSGNGTNALVNSNAERFDGKMKLVTGAVSNEYSFLYLPGDIFTPATGTNWACQWRFKIPTTNAALAIVGIQTHIGYELVYDSGGGAARRSAGAFLILTNGMTQFNLEVRTFAGAIERTALSGVTVNSNWNTIYVTKTNDAVYMGVNGSAPVYVTNGLANPSHSYSPVAAIITGEAAAKELWLDYCFWRSPRTK